MSVAADRDSRYGQRPIVAALNGVLTGAGIAADASMAAKARWPAPTPSPTSPSARPNPPGATGELEGRTNRRCLDLVAIDRLTGGLLGTFDVPCPICGPSRRSQINCRRRVMRVWRIEPTFATFHCTRCGEKGHTRDRSAPPPDLIALERARAVAAARERDASAERLGKARGLWSVSIPLTRTIAEGYLRDARGYGGPLPSTLRFLPARGKHGPAMIAAFGLAHEVEPGVIAIASNALRGVHITRLLPDGSGREHGDQAKIMVGHSTGWPIVLAPPNDMLGFAITEGVEDALTLHEATGLGVWAAGSASRMPAIANAIPSWIDCVTVSADDDADGRRFATELVTRIRDGGIEASAIIAGLRAAA